MTNKKNVFHGIFLVMGWLIGGCQPGDAKTSALESMDSSCDVCQCLQQFGEALLSKTSNLTNFDLDLSACKTSSLPPPESEFLKNNLQFFKKKFKNSEKQFCEIIWSQEVENIIRSTPVDPSCQMSSDPELQELEKAALRRCNIDQHFSDLSPEAELCEDNALRIQQLLNMVTRIENGAWMVSLKDNEIIALYESEAARDAIYIIGQHAEMFRAGQVRVLTVLVERFKSGESRIRAQDIASLHDRISIAKSKTQTYATHTSCTKNGVVPAFPVEASPIPGFPTRESLGLSPIEEFFDLRSEKTCNSNN